VPRRPWQPIALLVLIGWLLLVAGCANNEAPARAASLPPTPSPSPSPTPSPTPAPTRDARPPLERTVNILLLGSDQRPGEPNWRTDVMMIIAVDLAQQRVGVISIPRDVFLDEIPNHRPNKINVVDYLGEQDEPDGGGPRLLSSVLAERMDIRIDYYLRFGFEGFRKVIDAVGGIDVEVECTYRDGMAGLYLSPGHHTMDGQLALKYVRSRYTTSDLDRNRRQQQVIWAVRQAVVNKNLLPRLPAIYTAVSESVETDIDLITAVRLLRFGLDLEPGRVYSLALSPPDLIRPGWRLGMEVFVADWAAIAHATQRIFERAPMTAAEMAGAQGEERTCFY
jgi:LCP family protein required for cell wall assembly